MMHSQVLVIYPPDVDLKDVMYPYQEVDKYQKDKMTDDRCEFFLGVEEKDIPSLLDEIHEYHIMRRRKCLEEIQYRSEHTYRETMEKYGKNALKHSWDVYKIYCNDLKEYEMVKDLPYDDPRQIKFILDNAWQVNEEDYLDIFIKGKGYGTFHNPYELWDYFQLTKDRGFHKEFLIGNDDRMYAQIALKDLDVSKTVENIHELSHVWEHVIFCEKDAGDSSLYSIDDIRLDKKWNRHCLIKNMIGVESLEDVLLKIAEKYGDGDYIVTALDFHW